MRLRMAGLCSKSEQCSSDIRLKLRKAGLNQTATEEIMNFLIENKFISDSRYAKAYAADKVRFSAWGKRKIRAYLASKKIPAEFITEALEYIDEKDYEEAVFRAAKAKASSLDLSDREDLQKLYRHLLSRGFESTYISKTISLLKSE